MGGFNAKVGGEKVEDVVGTNSTGTVTERGRRLIEWCQINDFTITNTWYQNHPRRQWTWRSPVIEVDLKYNRLYSRSETIPKRCQNIEITVAGRR
ncbi:craniofacial development protein 2-like protein [Plakobranchus ocellatus]|uniref:Craniofacial development protein 2-like protein n=1 Tax=Plakobranchus ocellatus TaxID=259542 RepID=A0AAV4B7I9_9GAST|nr:craniofacial development protein 2-like protein [Plakobranchus ocellatus]